MKRLVLLARSRRPVRIVYGGKSRIVEIHTFGLTRSGKPVVRAYQREGASDLGWKLLHVDRIESFEDAGGADIALRPDHQTKDAQMSRILWAITEESRHA